jgi:hypothetical protein
MLQDNDSDTVMTAKKIEEWNLLTRSYNEYTKYTGIEGWTLCHITVTRIERWTLNKVITS